MDNKELTDIIVKAVLMMISLKDAPGTTEQKIILCYNSLDRFDISTIMKSNIVSELIRYIII